MQSNTTQMLQVSYKAFHDIDYLTNTDKSYINLDPKLKPFYNYKPDLDSFESVINAKSQHQIDRKLIQDVLLDQYQGIALTPLQNNHIKALESNNTFTVVTAHQPVLFTGPLYYIYKIASCINLARQLSVKFPSYHFVPIFINGAEDHDFDEINHCHVFQNKITWNSDGGGSVGKLSTDGLQDAYMQLSDILGSSPYADEIRSIIKNSISESLTYGDMPRLMLQMLFGDHGLMVLNMDDVRFKRAFIPIIEREIFTQFSQPLVEKTQAEMSKLGFKNQAYSRSINFFYISPGRRDRIEKHGDRYVVVNSDITFSDTQMQAEIKNQPERFSPNVIIRPLYQESILPNLAYIGGGGELAYWLERKSQFEAAGIPYPMLIRRASALILQQFHMDVWIKLGLDAEALWSPKHVISDRILALSNIVDLNIKAETEQINLAYESLSSKAGMLNPGLQKMILAEKVKQLKHFEQLAYRLKKELKTSEEQKINKALNIKEKLFPGDGLQERYDNVFQYYNRYGRMLIDDLVKVLNPLSQDLYILTPVE